LQTYRAKDYGYGIYKNAKKGIGTIGKAVAEQFSDETIKAIVNTAKKTKDITKAVLDGTLEAALNTDKSTARAFIDDVSNGKANKRIYDFSSKQLTELAKAFEGNKKAQDLIRKAQIRKSKALKDLGLEGNKESTEILDIITSTATNLSNSSVADKLRGLFSVSVDKISDSNVVKKMKDVMDSIETDTDLKEKLTPDQYKHYRNLEKAIEEAENELSSEKSKLKKDDTQKAKETHNFPKIVDKVANGDIVINAHLETF